MNSSALRPLHSTFNYQHRRRQSFSISITAAFRPHDHPRRQRRRRLPNFNNPSPPLPLTSEDPGLSTDSSVINLSINLNPIKSVIDSGIDAFNDLTTSIRIDPYTHHVTFTCRRSSVVFLRDIVLVGMVLAVAVKVVMNLKLGFGERNVKVVTRRDRSMGGREVVVGSVLNSERRDDVRVLDLEKRKERLERKKEKNEKVPEWWVEVRSDSARGEVDEWAKKEADQLVRAILADRLGGKDYKDDDIIQLRHICKTSGARVSFGAENSRDSFYRASVNFVLNICSRVMQPPSVSIEIGGEGVRQFICGLAENIGLEVVRAAKIVRASVAARARSCFLQTWAYEVQGKRFEALQELSKICQIFQIFPPEEYSPEMEMVASGLKKTIGLEQRRHLLSLFNEICGSNCQNVAEEALDLGQNQWIQKQ